MDWILQQFDVLVGWYLALREWLVSLSDPSQWPRTEDLVVSLTVTGLALATQWLAETLQLWRMGRNDRPVSYFFPGMEFVVAGMGLVFAGWGAYFAASTCNCDPAPELAKLITAVVVVVVSFVILLDSVSDAGVSAGAGSGLRSGDELHRELTQISDSGTNPRETYQPSYLKGSYWGGLFVLLLVSALVP